MDDKANELLLAEIRNLTQVIEKLVKRQSPWYSFGHGMMSSLGYFVGAAVVVSLIVYLLQKIGVMPMISNSLNSLNQLGLMGK